MTTILLALFFADAAVNSAEFNDYGIVEQDVRAGLDLRVEPTRRVRAWDPNIQSQSARRAECPALFSREIHGFGTFKLGPTCDPDNIPR